MKCYLAPLEGITGYILRNGINKFFGTGIDRFYTPFIVAHEKKAMSNKEINDINPDNNKGINLIPQVLTNKSEDYLRLEDVITSYGYDEINLNLGCPSRTVVSKKRGSGFLEDIDELDRFFYTVFSKKKAKMSVKTRIGIDDTDEFYKILEVYNRYEIAELIIHPRLQKEMYKYTPHMDMFLYAMENTSIPLCYNGDINTIQDANDISAKIGVGDNISIMIGRGMIANPGLIREIKTGIKVTDKEIKDFLTYIRETYESVLYGEKPVLEKLKEIWTYLRAKYPTREKEFKEIFKCKTLAQYKAIETVILSS